MQLLKYTSCFLFLLQTIVVQGQKAEASKIIREQLVPTAYDSIISKAGLAFSREQFDSASLYYKQALILKPSDGYAVKMLKNVEVGKWELSQKQVKDLVLKRKAEINTLMKDALAAIISKNYDSARSKYSRVLTLDPVASQKEFAQQKIQGIDATLAGTNKSSPEKVTPTNPVTNRVPTISAPMASNTRVSTPPAITQDEKKQNIATTTIKRANQNTKVKDDTASIITSAYTYKVGDKKVQNAVLAAIKLNDQSAKANVDTGDTPRNKFTTATTGTASSKAEAKPVKTEVDRLIDDALTAILNQNYEAARIIYSRVLITSASKQQKEFAKRKIQAIDQQIKKQSSIVAESKKPFTGSSTKNVERKQEVDQTSITTGKKVMDEGKSNNNISDVSTQKIISPEKTFINKPSNSTPIENTEQIVEISSTILLQKPRLDLTDSNNHVTLVCQDIRVNGKNSFLKFAIQNNGESDFTPGLLQLLYINNYGILQNLKPNYLTDMKAIAPKKEMQLIYATHAPVAVEASEVFIFEMEDKMKKTKLAINIPGEVYLNKKNN